MRPTLSPKLRPTSRRGRRPNLGPLPPVRQHRRRSRGQSLVEFALILPILLLLVVSAADAGRLFFAYVTIENAAREGAFFGALHPECDTAKAGCGDPNNVTWHVAQDLTGVQGTSATITCVAADGSLKSPGSCLEGDSYRVTVSYPFPFLTPLVRTILGPSLTLTATESSLVLNTAYGAPATPTPAPTPTPTPTPTPAPTPCVNPTVTFSGSPTEGQGSSVTVTFNGTSTGTPISWLWTFGDGETSTTPLTTSHQYSRGSQNGTIRWDVTLTVTTGATCSTTVTKNNYITLKP